jgi:DNA-binding NarL/FixJ family response regulator
LRKSIEQYPDLVVCGEASDGAEAIERSKQLNPDLVILDLSMPGVGRLAAARELKRIRPAVMLLMYTTFKDSTVEKEALAAGCADVISKSDVHLLFRRIELLLKERSA